MVASAVNLLPALRFSGSTHAQLVVPGTGLDLSSPRAAYTVFLMAWVNTTGLPGQRSYGPVLTQQLADAGAADGSTLTNASFALGFIAGGFMDTAAVGSQYVAPLSTPAVLPGGTWVLYELLVTAGASATLMRWVNAIKPHS